MAVEGLALLASEIKLFLSRLTGTVAGLFSHGQYCILFSGQPRRSQTYRESTSTPRAAATDLREITKQVERSLISQWYVDEAVVSQGRHSRQSRTFLPTTLSAGADEKTGHFAPVSSSLPDTAGLVPESLPLSWEVAISGWNTEEESVVFQKRFGVFKNWDALVLWWSVHLI